MNLGVPCGRATSPGALPYPLLVAMVSGASVRVRLGRLEPDLRAVHMLSAVEVVGLRTGPDTLQHTGAGRVELDVVSHDLLKLARLLTGRSGYVLEQLFIVTW
jgi:predicted nucleotidyltransferase